VIHCQLRHATQHDFTTIIAFVQAMLNEMEVLSSREPTDRAEAWLAFESRILQTLSCDEIGAYTYPCVRRPLVSLLPSANNFSWLAQGLCNLKLTQI
jgi:hypothetical protein